MTDPALLGRHLAAAVGTHLARLRRDHIPAPPELVALFDALTTDTPDAGLAPPLRALRALLFAATSGHERPSLAPSPTPAEGGPVLLLTTSQAAGRLGISDRSARRLIAAGDLPSVRLGGQRRVRAADLAAYVDRLERLEQP